MREILLRVFIWLGSKLFPLVDIYSPKHENVEAITFSNNERYIEKISDIEL